jgi:hypothetical protein
VFGDLATDGASAIGILCFAARSVTQRWNWFAMSRKVNRVTG